MEYKVKRPFKEWILLNLESFLSGRGYIKRTIIGYSYNIKPNEICNKSHEKFPQFDKF